MPQLRLFLLPLLLLPSCGAEVQETRSLANLRIDQVPAFPGGLPRKWAKQFDEVLATLPELSVSDPTSLTVAHDALLQLPWVDRESLVVEPALPEGLRAYFRPLRPCLTVTQAGRPVAALAYEDGRVLPAGIDATVLAQFLEVPLDPGTELPVAGRIPADPLLQEARRLFPEVDEIRRLTGLPIVRLQRKSGYPIQADGIAPAMSFWLDTGVEISWGRARDTFDPYALDSTGSRLTMEAKALRLRAVLEQFPLLMGLSRVVLDEPVVKVYDEHGQLVELESRPR